MTDREWIDAFAVALDLPAPSGAEVDAILDLAAEAAHSSARTAAPVACWMAAAAGRTPAAALALARTIGGREAEPR